MDIVQASESFREVIDFVERLYIELAQTKTHFNDYSCIFCSCAYFELNALISHIEDFHRDQILQGTFDLERNFEEFLRSRILGSSGAAKDEVEASQSPYEMYQCAKCQQTFVSVADITEHLVICSRNEVCQQQQQQSHHHQQQQQTQIEPPAVQNQNLYGCARCGYRFGLLRDLVLHLHSCSNDIFYNKHEYLLPHLYVQAPNNQHIVVNEAETNTTLNTPALWLMSNITGPCTEDSVMKGFWVMPPPNNHSIPLKAVVEKKAEPPALLLLQPAATNSAAVAVPSRPKAAPSTAYSMPTYVINELPENNRLANAAWSKPQQQATEVINKRKRTTEIIRQQEIPVTTPPVINKRKRVYQPAATAVVPPPAPLPPPPPVQVPVPPVVHHTVASPQSTAISSMPQFENYVITFDDNTTQIISPGDELYEHVVNSYKEKLTESNVVDLVANSTPSPTDDPLEHHTMHQSIIHQTHHEYPTQSNMNTATQDSEEQLIESPLDDLSHLDKPISAPPRLKIASPKDHYLASYYSFLEMRHQNKV